MVYCYLIFLLSIKNIKHRLNPVIKQKQNIVLDCRFRKVNRSIIFKVKPTDDRTL